MAGLMYTVERSLREKLEAGDWRSELISKFSTAGTNGFPSTQVKPTESDEMRFSSHINKSAFVCPEIPKWKNPGVWDYRSSKNSLYINNHFIIY